MKGPRSARTFCAGLVMAAALSLAGCGPKPDVEPEAKHKGGDYLSTTFRARERAVRRLDEANEIRKEQIKDEQEFDRPSKRQTRRTEDSANAP
jgi:hypothetical protein